MPERPVADRPEVNGHAPEQPNGLARLQRAFAAHIRDPSANPPPADVEERRIAIYRRLFFDNISSLLAGNFPVLRSLCDDERWQQLVRAFYAEHRCRTPLFPEVAKEFLRYVQDREPRAADPPFMLELAHYEWVELALSLDERELDEVAANPAGNLLDEPPVLSPLAWALSYRYPVHLIQPDFQPAQPPAEPTHLLVYRNRRDRVRFMRLNQVTRLLLQQLLEAPRLSGRDHLDLVAQTIRHPDPARVIEAGTRVLQDLLERDVLLGTRPEG
jgi:uncharacterized protein